MADATPAPDLKTKTISDLATLIKRDWKTVYFGAVPYLEAMYSLTDLSSRYGADDGRSIVLYFLSNASSWRGETAKAVKAELNRRLKAK